MESCFIVNSKDLFNVRKNPTLSLSTKDILNNDRISKMSTEKCSVCHTPMQYSTAAKEWFCPQGH